jgi:hypothetical protein
MVFEAGKGSLAHTAQILTRRLEEGEDSFGSANVTSDDHGHQGSTLPRSREAMAMGVCKTLRVWEWRRFFLAVRSSARV